MRSVRVGGVDLPAADGEVPILLPTVIRSWQTIALCVIALLVLGVVMVNSAGMSVTPVGADRPEAPPISARTILTSRSTVYMALALAAMAVAACLPIRALSSWVQGFGGRRGEGALKPLLIVAGAILAVCCLVYLPGIGKEVNGSHRWLRLPIPQLGDALSVQPSEIAKWGLVGLVAWYGAVRRERLPELLGGLIPGLVAIGMVSVVIVKEDLGTGVLIATVCCLMLAAAGAWGRWFWQALIFVPPALIGVVLAVVTSDYRTKRILAFVNPYEDAQGIGYHTIQSLVAVAGGDIFGRGLGHGLQKFAYLPEDTTDFLFAIICEELGVPGAMIVASLFAGIVWCGMTIVRAERDMLLRLWGFGVIAMVGLQAVFNLAVVTGLAPTKGIALPLLSSGGTGWILTAFSIGIVIAIERSREAGVVTSRLEAHTGAASVAA